MGDRSNFGAGSLYGGISFSDQAAKDAAEAPKEDPRKNWSAALAFAPPPRRPAPFKLKPPRTSAALFFDPTPGVASSSNPTDAVRQADPVVRIPPPTSSTSSSSYSSAPTAFTTSYSPPSSSSHLPPPPNPSAAPQPSSRALPSMTIEEDVNGFKKRPGGGGGASGGGRYGNNGGKKRKKQGPVGPAFEPHEMYDPSRPNDVLEYKRWREEEKKRKERARREKRERAAQAAKQGGGGGSESEEGSYYSEDEREEQVTRGFGAHPPPKSYTDASSNPYPVFTSSSAPPPPPPPSSLAVPRAETGEKAYLRRAGISSTAPPSFAPPSFAPSSSISTPLNPESQPFIPAAPPAPPPPTFVPLDADAIKKKLEAGRLAAIAIAAKFAKPPSFGGPVPPMPGAKEKELDEDGVEKVKDERDFAVRMMEKWGHKEGEGLGVNASGIKEALQVAKTTVAKQGRRDFDDAEGGGGGSSSKPTRGMGAMGKIVSSETTARKQAEDRERFGEPSKVVLLEQMVGSPEEVDDSLSEDVGEECGKHGVVTRVLIHTVNPPPSDPALAIRIFVVFSGPAGAWTAIRALDGRFFGGRTVKARYFDETRFEYADRDD